VISLKDFEDTGALLKGHFRLSSGLHSDTYLQCARLLQWPVRAEAAGRELAPMLTGFAPRVIVSPALGGLIIGHETARALGVPFLFAERQDGAFTLRRGFAIEAGDPVAIVEDVFTTGKSTREVIETVNRAGGRAVAAGSIVDRGLPADALPVPTRSLVRLSVPAWPQEECPLPPGRASRHPGSRHPKT
jgi:orotate phosphoribosyltransferase